MVTCKGVSRICIKGDMWDINIKTEGYSTDKKDFL